MTRPLLLPARQTLACLTCQQKAAKHSMSPPAHLVTLPHKLSLQLVAIASLVLYAWFIVETAITLRPW